MPPLSFGGALVVRPWPRFHTPLIEPDTQISRIRLSDKTSRLHPRHVVPKPAQAYEPKVPVKMREWRGAAGVTCALLHDRPLRSRRAHLRQVLSGLRQGNAWRLCAPDVVAYPRNEAEISAVMDWTSAVGASLTPFGGGSSVCGGVEPRVDGIKHKAAVTLDLRNLAKVVEVDRYRVRHRSKPAPMVRPWKTSSSRMASRCGTSRRVLNFRRLADARRALQMRVAGLRRLRRSAMVGAALERARYPGVERMSRPLEREHHDGRAAVCRTAAISASLAAFLMACHCSRSAPCRPSAWKEK